MTTARTHLFSRSITLRVAVSSSLMAALLLVGGAAWTRSVLYESQLRATRTLASQQVETLTTLIQANVRFDGDYGPLPYEVVGSDGTIVSSSTTMKPFEADGPMMAVPGVGAASLVDISWAAQFPDLGEPPLAGRKLTAVSTTIAASTVSANNTADRPGDLGATGTYRVYVFATTTAADAIMTALDPPLFTGVALAVLLVAAASAVSVRRALRPVEELRLAAERVGQPTTRQQQGAGSDARTPIRTTVADFVPVSATHDELQSLARTINDMLIRVQTSSVAQRRFAADAAHELRTPIASMLTALEIADTYPERIEPTTTIRHAIAQARRLQLLSQELLDSVAAVDGPLDLEPVAAAPLLRAAAERAQAEHVGINITLEQVPAEIWAAAPQLMRVLDNLLDNACRHAADDIFLAARPDGATYTVTVTNDGPPLPPGTEETVFEPFTRLDGARDREHGGAGLGLAIARSIAVRHGGSLTATSHATGVTFTLRLQLVG